MRPTVTMPSSSLLPRASLLLGRRLGSAAAAPVCPASHCASLASRCRPARGGTFRRGAAVAPACSLPEEAFRKAVDALKEVHDKPTDREVVAAGEAAVATAAKKMQHAAATSKTVGGYLLHEAPIRTWLPFVACTLAAAAGATMRRQRIEWAAIGGIFSFFFTVWQVLAPLARRFMALRARLLDNDRAAKHRLDLAAEQLNKAACERGRARQEAQQARGELRRLKHAIGATVAAAGGLLPSAGPGGGGSGYSSSAESDAATAVEHAAQRLEALRGMLEERQEQDKRLLGVLNNALNAAAVPNILAGEHGCTDTPDDAMDGFGERAIGRGNAVELAGALQGRVDALRRQIMEAAEAQETVAALREQAEEQQKELIRLHSELRERTDEAASLHAQLDLATADARRLPLLQERLQALERQLKRLDVLHVEREGLEVQLGRLQALEAERAALERQLAQREAELAAEREAAASASSGSGADSSGEREGGEEGAQADGSPAAAEPAVGEPGSGQVAVDGSEAAEGEPEAGLREAEAGAQAAGEQPTAAAHASPAPPEERAPSASASSKLLSGLLGLAVTAGAVSAAAASRQEEQRVVAELDGVRVQLRRAERFLQAYDKAVPALADKLLALQEHHEQLERTQAELVAQHEADEAAGSKCLELAEAVLAAAHEVEGEHGAAAAQEGEAQGAAQAVAVQEGEAEDQQAEGAVGAAAE